MAGGKLLFRTIVSRSIEIRFVVGSGVLPLCGFSLGVSAKATVLGAKLWGGDALSALRLFAAKPGGSSAGSVGGIRRRLRESELLPSTWEPLQKLPIHRHLG